MELASASTEERWKQAFEKLGKEDSDVLHKEMGLSDSSCVSPDELANAVKRKVDEHDAKGIQFAFKGKSVKLRELGERLMRFVLSFKNTISLGCTASPYASLAWSGIAITLEIIGTPTEQNEAMSKGLLKVTEMLKLYRVRDELYLNGSRRTDDRLKAFEDLVISLYSRILQYQARMIKHLSHKAIHRATSNILKSVTWQDWLLQIEEVDESCNQYRELLDKSSEAEKLNSISSRIEMSTDIQQQLLEIQKSFVEEQQALRRGDREESLLHSFVFAYESDKNMRQEANPGTREWFLSVPTFTKWLDQDQSCFIWISAGPGCGKSVLTRFLVDKHHLRKSITSSFVTYFFFRDGQTNFSNAANALRAIIHQIFSSHPHRRLIDHALKDFRSHGDQLRDDLDRLWDILIALANDPQAGQIICAIDALDECEPNSRARFSAKLIQFYQNPSAASSKLKFIVTSRRYDTIRSGFEQLDTVGDSVEIDSNQYSHHIAQDIDKVLESEVRSIFKTRNLESQNKIITHLRNTESRTYLWLLLVLESLRKYRNSSTRDIAKHLQDVPSTLSDSYERILRRREDCDEQKTIFILMLVVAASRPLTLQEINVANALQSDNPACENLKRADIDLWDEPNIREILEDICGLFIQVFDGKVYLLHQTAREFLLGTAGRAKEDGSWKGVIDISEAHGELAAVCMRCTLLCQQYGNVVEPFRQYSSKHWAEHYRLSGTKWQYDTVNLAVELCGEMRSTWLHRHDGGHDYSVYELSQLVKYSYLIFAARLGLQAVVQHGLDAGLDVDGDSVGRPLIEATEHGHRDIVNMLLQNGADVNKGDKYNGSPLIHAVQLGDIELVEVFIAGGVDIDRLHGGRTALSVAIGKSQSKVLALLLERGAKVDVDGAPNLLLEALIYEDEMAVKLLLDYGAKLRTQDQVNEVFIKVSEWRSSNRLKLLLERGRDINACPQNEMTALQAASVFGHTSTAEALLENGADINAHPNYPRTVLQIACSSFSENERLVKLFLKNGVDVNAHPNNSTTALQIACSSLNPNKEIVKLLLDNGADVNAHPNNSKTALQMACFSCHRDKKIVKLLLENGADVNAHPNNSRTALQTGCFFGFKEVVQLLLEHGADIHIKLANGYDAIEAAYIDYRYRSSDNNSSIIQMLLDRGAQPSAESKAFLLTKGLKIPPEKPE